MTSDSEIRIMKQIIGTAKITFLPGPYKNTKKISEEMN